MSAPRLKTLKGLLFFLLSMNLLACYQHADHAFTSHDQVLNKTRLDSIKVNLKLYSIYILNMFNLNCCQTYLDRHTDKK